MRPDDAIRLIAEQQLGLVRRSQLAELDLSRNQVATRVQRGMLERLSPSVLRLVGSPTTPAQRALAAVFDAGAEAALSRCSAAAWWQVPNHRLLPAHVTRARGGSGRSHHLGIVHAPMLDLRRHVITRGAIPVVSPSMMLFELASTATSGQLARVVDDVLARRLSNATMLHKMLEKVAARGRTGITTMRQVLAERPPGSRGPQTNLEARVREIARRGGLPEPECQVDVGDRLGWIAQVDFLFRAFGLILFVDGDAWHSMLLDRLGDESQQQRLERAGYRILRIREPLVFRRPREVLAAIEYKLRERAA